MKRMFGFLSAACAPNAKRTERKHPRIAGRVAELIASLLLAITPRREGRSYHRTCAIPANNPSPERAHRLIRVRGHSARRPFLARALGVVVDSPRIAAAGADLGE